MPIKKSAEYVISRATTNDTREEEVSAIPSEGKINKMSK